MQVLDATYIISSPSLKDCPKPAHPEFAFIGRSNVGKSSLINALVNKKNLAKTSATPGKTKLINHFQVDTTAGSWYLVDLPGYGFARVSQGERKKWQTMIADYIRQRESLVCVFVLIDARHSPQPIDLEFIRQLGAWAIPFGLVFTKTDKETQKVVQQHVAEFRAIMLKTWEALPPIFITSAVKRTGTNKLLGYIDAVLREDEALPE